MADTGDFTTPTWEELSDKQRRGYEFLGRKHKEDYEALKKKREEEFERLKKQHEEEDFQEYIKLSPPSGNHVGPSVMLWQDKKETLQANQQEKIDSANTVESL